MQVATARMQVNTGTKVYDQWMNPNTDKKKNFSIKLYIKHVHVVSLKIKQEGLKY